MEPLSKCTMLRRLDSYYEKPAFSHQHILRFMVLLEEHYEDYLAWIYQQSNTIVKGDPSVLYYNCSNFYFECEKADDDIMDEVTGAKFIYCADAGFDGRPVHHRLPKRIKAHFLICYTALLVYRLLEAKLDDQGTHVTPDSLIKTLKNMDVANVQDIDYMALYKGSRPLDALTQLTMLPLDKCHYMPKDLNKIIK